MEHRGEHYTGFINTDNSQKIPTAEKQLKIGKQISFESIRRHLDGIYRTYE
jgi:hypothetical protein